MPDQNSPEITATGVDSYDDTYLAWRMAALEAQQALRDWFDASAEDRVLRFFAYRAALDREEAAARDLQRLTELGRPCPDALGDRHTDSTNDEPDGGPARRKQSTTEAQASLHHS